MNALVTANFEILEALPLLSDTTLRRAQGMILDHHTAKTIEGSCHSVATHYWCDLDRVI